jgi:hypothetical protein
MFLTWDKFGIPFILIDCFYAKRQILVTVIKNQKLISKTLNTQITNSELDRLSVSDFKEADKTPIIIILDDIRSFIM